MDFYYHFTINSLSSLSVKRIVKIGQHLAKFAAKKCSGTFFPDMVQIFLLPEMVNKDERYDVKTVDLNVLQEGTLIEQNAPYYH